MDFVITFEEIKKLFVVKISGDIDAYHSAAFKQKVMEHMENTDKKYIVLDMSEVSYIDSAGLGSIVSLIKESKKLEKELVLVSLKKQIKKIFEMTKLDKIIRMEDTIEEI
jgi:anti-sigma B factor antagonist